MSSGGKSHAPDSILEVPKANSGIVAPSCPQPRPQIVFFESSGGKSARPPFTGCLDFQGNFWDA